uniref:Uncharacterized protein n=1 Tax=Triticum urartu TaxID=4572 RepID=A0A8R7JVV8_TRIUA
MMVLWVFSTNTEFKICKRERSCRCDNCGTSASMEGSLLRRRSRSRLLGGRLLGLRHGLLARAEGGEDGDGGHLEAPEEVLVGLHPGGHGLELREVVGAVEAALVDGAGEVVELEAPLLLEVAVGAERRRDLVGAHEEPGVHAAGAGAERLPARALDRRREVRVLGDQQPRRGGERGADAAELRHREAVAPDAREELAPVQLAPERLLARPLHRQPDRRQRNPGGAAHGRHSRRWRWRRRRRGFWGAALRLTF